MNGFDQANYILWHQQLLANDPVVPALVAEHFLLRLFQYLKTRNPNLDEHLLYSAVDDALFNYVSKPTSFKPELGISLSSYLQMSAQNDLRNELKKVQRYNKRNKPLETVELTQDTGNNIIESEFLTRQMIQQELQTHARQLQDVAESELDQQLLGLMQENERRTEAYATVLSITHLPVTEQRRLVKQHKDRLKLRLKRRSQAATKDAGDQKKSGEN